MARGTGIEVKAKLVCDACDEEATWEHDAEGDECELCEDGRLVMKFGKPKEIGFTVEEEPGGGATITFDKQVVVDPNTTDRIAGLCPDCLEVKCECSPGRKQERKAAKLVKRGEDGIAREVPTRSSPAGPSAPKARKAGVKKGVGRGGSGRIRNFGAMGNSKLLSVRRQLELENPIDTDALDKAEQVISDRGL